MILKQPSFVNVAVGADINIFSTTVTVVCQDHNCSGETLVEGAGSSSMKVDEPHPQS